MCNILEYKRQLLERLQEYFHVRELNYEYRKPELYIEIEDYKEYIDYLHNKYPLIDDPDNCQKVMYYLVNIYNDENTNDILIDLNNENEIFTNNLLCYISGMRDNENIESIMSFIQSELEFIHNKPN